MPIRRSFSDHADYIAAAPQEAREALTRIHKRVAAAVPGAEPCISYSMPAFRRGKVFFYFAAFKSHIGVYPPLRDDAALVRELAPYRNEKGNLAFPYARPIPLALIERVAVALAAQYASQAPTARKKSSAVSKPGAAPKARAGARSKAAALTRSAPRARG